MSSLAGEFLRTTRESTVSTTDATVTTIETIPIPPNQVFHLRATVVALRTGGASGSADDSASYVIEVTYKDVSGTATILGAATTDAAEDQAGWNAAFSVSGSTVLLRVTGAASNNINWASHVDITKATL